MELSRSVKDRPGRYWAVLYVSAPTIQALRATRPSDESAGDSMSGLSDDQVAWRVTDCCGSGRLG